MKVSDHSNDREAEIVATMIEDDSFLAQISAKWQNDMLASKACNQVAGWCVKHHLKYGKAPRKAIKSHFSRWADGNPSEAAVGLVSELLQTLADRHQRNGDALNVSYLIDVAGDHFNKVRLSRLNEQLSVELQAGQMEKAESLVTKHTRIELGGFAAFDPFTQEEVVTAAFASKDHAQPLVSYGGDLDYFFYNALERDQFLAFAGPQKSGKTWWLFDLVWRAMLNRRKVALFNIGDLSKNKVTSRFCVRAAKHPSRSENGKWPCMIHWPISIEPPPPKEHFAKVTFRSKTFKKPLDARTAWEANKRVMQERIKSKRSYYQSLCYPNLSVSILGIKAEIETLTRNGFAPDVVVIDYADNLAPVEKLEEVRDRVNMTWKHMKAISQEFHCLLVTGTQVNAKSFSKKKGDVLDKGNFSEDNRKLSHVDGMVGINLDGEEKEKGLCRLNWIVKREGEYNVRRVCHVAGCLALASPAVLSVYPRLGRSEASSDD